MKEIEQLLTVDRRNDDYVTVFHLAGCLWRMHSHVLLMRTMQLCGLLNARPRGTMTNRIANSRKLNLNSNLQIELQIFELCLTTLVNLTVALYSSAKHGMHIQHQ